MFTYDIKLTETKDQLRFLTGDTTEGGHFLEDSEIEFFAGLETNLYRTAAVLCRTIAARINKLPGFRDKHQFDPEKKAEEYRNLAKDFDLKAESSSSLTIDAMSLSGFVNDPADSSPMFTRRLHQS
jgi:hypothetical protein